MMPCRCIQVDSLPHSFISKSAIIHVAVSSEGLLVGPMNTAVVVGSRTTLNCSSDNNSPFWIWRMPNSTIIVSSTSPCVVNPSFAGIFDVSAPTTGSSYCDLIIFSATSAGAGSYYCSDGTAIGASAVLLVLGELIVSYSNILFIFQFAEEQQLSPMDTWR